jgi:hypothetical protein
MYYGRKTGRKDGWNERKRKEERKCKINKPINER